MIRYGFGLFIILHGLVHLLYFGQSQRYFELQPGMVWPDRSWAFSNLVGEQRTRVLAGSSCLLAAAGFVVGGVGLLTVQAWWQPVVIASAVLSCVMFISLWGGKFQNLDDEGGIGTLINLAILLALLWV